MAVTHSGLQTPYQQPIQPKQHPTKQHTQQPFTHAQQSRLWNAQNEHFHISLPPTLQQHVPFITKNPRFLTYSFFNTIIPLPRLLLFNFCNCFGFVLSFSSLNKRYSRNHFCRRFTPHATNPTHAPPNSIRHIFHQNNIRTSLVAAPIFSLQNRPTQTSNRK